MIQSDNGISFFHDSSQMVIVLPCERAEPVKSRDSAIENAEVESSRNDPKRRSASF